MNATKSADPVLVIDVRSPGEFAAGHVEGSINLPLTSFAQEITRVAPDKTAPIVLCCATGGRSGMACSFMLQNGYTRVSNGGGAASLAGQLMRPIVRD
ncbi:MAG: Rhodanese domain protein [Rhodocyclaceae bacterium]|nr:Rhodanese domain protein [Rhodocyclaceae bacterium]